MDEKQKTLTPSQKADKLWGKIKARAANLGHGRLAVELVIDGGHIVMAEIIAERETLIGD